MESEGKLKCAFLSKKQPKRKYLQIPQTSGSADTDPVLCRRFKEQNKNQKPTAIKKKKTTLE